MNKLGLIIVVLIIIGAVGIFALGGKKNTDKNMPPTPTASQTENDKTSGTAVTVTSSGYDPQSLTIKAGTKVIWTNKSGVAVTVDSALHPTHLVYPPLNLGQFEDGSSKELVFDKAGTYRYHNHLNPTQFGSIIVE